MTKIRVAPKWGVCLNCLNIILNLFPCKIYDKRNDLTFEKVNFPFFDEDVPRFPLYGVYISQLIRFVRVCSNDGDFNIIKTMFDC